MSREIDWRTREDWKELKEAYKTLGRVANFKVGDKVKILRKADSCELGWCASWQSQMDRFVGKEGKIVNILECGCPSVEIDGEVWSYPWFVLELVEPVSEKHTIIVNGKSTEVSEEAFNEIKNLFE